MATATRTVAEVCASAKQASRELATATTETKEAALARIAGLLGERSGEILEANAADLADERAVRLTDALRDRLALDEERVAAMADGVRAIAALPDPVGEVIEERSLVSGLRMKKVRVPLGVIAVVYEARPNVTVD
jgi:glutamate-5-semialdehyde dehydrogenase